MPIPFYKIGNIQAFVQKHGGKMDVPQRVIPAVLQMCLSFTLVARLAPDWNKAGHLLIHGKNFLGKEEKQNAVVLELNVSETQLCVSVEASTIRLTLAKVEDFDISIGVLKNFCSKRIAVLPKHFIGSNWCYVLPSMKKGQIVSISHEIPPYCPFQSYGDFQKHWTNMYGYNLPEIKSDSALYYTVYFKLIGEKLFTYPSCCIRSEPVQFFPRVDLESVLTSFFSDFKKTFPSLCGSPIKITSKPYYTTNELNVSQVKTPKNVQEQECRNKEEDLFEEAQKQKSSMYISVGKPNTNQIQNSYSDTVKNMCKDTLLLQSNIRILKPGATQLGSFQEKCMRNTQFRDENAIGITSFDGTCTKWIDNPMEHQHKQVLDMFDTRKQFNHEKQTHFHDLSSKSLTGRNFSDKGTEKRKCEEKATDSKPKKPKAKPVIQDVDVEKHAKNNQLSKLNTVTLHSWLKCRGVSVKTRDKKEQLVSKIMEFIKGLYRSATNFLASLVPEVSASERNQRYWNSLPRRGEEQRNRQTVRADVEKGWRSLTFYWKVHKHGRGRLLLWGRWHPGCGSGRSGPREQSTLRLWPIPRHAEGCKETKAKAAEQTRDRPVTLTSRGS
ncbi:uncharacterized protein C18orf63 homolog [Amblyraja radiata]|uniref:uncharacterized protein C18orf63 homolog n=1 Tax=Amblyraja radiata TaxID=386614 RepID=UPI0014035DD4|nr:uncharacterized protein C18orf63 homolog [Amblyraja radiata]